MKKYGFIYKKEDRQNPYIGFTSFQHFGTDTLYSDLVVRPENNMTETEHVECYPIPGYVEQRGTEEGFYPASSVCYIRILWKEFEPFEGVYRHDLIEDILSRASACGQSVMLRIMPHSTRESDDVPRWLKDIIPCPRRPVGERVKQSPRDPKFLELFGRAVKHIGERFGKDPRLAFLDVSLPGAWGEGCCVDFFTEEELKRFLNIYISSFENVHLINQGSSPELLKYIAAEVPVGWRADCIGHPKFTFQNVASRAEKLSDVWKRGHVSFESYWWLGEWRRQGWDIDAIIDATLSWHISTFNAKSLPIPFEWREKVERWNAKMGYHFVIDSVTVKETATVGEALELTLCVDNVGVAPIYKKHTLFVKLKGRESEYKFDTGVNICNWLPGKHIENINVTLPKDAVGGEYDLELGIGGGEEAEIVFASNTPKDGAYSVISKISLKAAL